MTSTPDRRDPAPYFEHHVFCCTNERPAGHPRGCCKQRGSEHLRDYMKGKAKELGIRGVRVNSAGCLDRCELGPTLVVYPEGVWYTVETEADVDEILQVHLVDGGRVERLMLQPTDKVPEDRTPERRALKAARRAAAG
ncbi:MAG TPA: (2Fe-2S) ferredoxin domain-containing protein [Azospirillaceae bacterium]|nr:(2Fe-2S) ferredoxin domain-containing protein [Azospirillaceae bacterium]